MKQSTTDQVKGAIDNPAVKGILLDIDSPGGETSGLFEGRIIHAL